MKFIAIVLALVTAFTSEVLAQGPTPRWITLVHTSASSSYIGDVQQGNFKITLDITAEVNDLFVHKVDGDFGLYHGAQLRLNGTVIQNPTTAVGYLNSLNVPGDTANYFAVLAGETRSFEFGFAVIPEVSGFYRWELGAIGISSEGNPINEPSSTVINPPYATGNVMLLSGTPEPSSVVLVVLGTSLLFLRRQRLHSKS
jgi:hypothetical protein